MYLNYFICGGHNYNGLVGLDISRSLTGDGFREGLITKLSQLIVQGIAPRCWRLLWESIEKG